MHNNRLPPLLRRLLPLAAGVLIALPVRAEPAKPFFFIQLSDPQFGFYAQNANFRQETANFEFAIATVNRLKPAFVIVTGDLVQKASEKPQADEYLRICAKLDPAIRLYQLPGNHDVGNDPTAESIAAYTARFGPDHYRFECGSLVGLAINSCLIYSPKSPPALVAAQRDWLTAELRKARQEKARHVVVFQHHPWFVTDASEADQYHNLPRAQRRAYLDPFEQAGVKHVFAGHYHANQIARDGALEIVTSGAIGKPLRKDRSGLRVVIVRDSGLEHQWFDLGSIPNQIDLSPPKKKAPAAKPAIKTR